MGDTLEQREDKRETRNGLGRFVMGLGVSLMAAGGLMRFDGPASHPAVATWMIGIGAPIALIGALWAWRNRAGEDARRLGASAEVVNTSEPQPNSRSVRLRS